jgi:hypothetical protein
MKNSLLIAQMATALLLLTGNAAFAQEYSAEAPAEASAAQPTEADKLAKQLSNPIAALISVPFQYNYDQTYGQDGYKNQVNIQPVIPVSISENWNMISRTILPIIQQGDVVPGTSQFGLGDTTQSLFFSPKKPTESGLIWGIGPVALIPTGTDNLSADTWAFGPTFVVLKQSNSWTVGALGNQLWATGGPADINAMFLQPFVAKALGKGRTISFNTETSYDWNNEQWTIPFNLIYSKVSKIGDHQLVSNAFGIRAYADTPYGNGPDWGVRYVFTLLFPKK